MLATDTNTPRSPHVADYKDLNVADKKPTWLSKLFDRVLKRQKQETLTKTLLDDEYK